MHLGVTVTVPSRIPFDIAALGDAFGAARALDRGWSRHILNHASSQRMLDELAGRGRKGITLMRDLLAERGPDYRPNDTNVEDRFQELAHSVGLKLERQRNLCDMGEWLGRVDFVDEKARLVIEVDTALYHDAVIDQVADTARRATLEAAGYRVTPSPTTRSSTTAKARSAGSVPSVLAFTELAPECGARAPQSGAEPNLDELAPECGARAPQSGARTALSVMGDLERVAVRVLHHGSAVAVGGVEGFFEDLASGGDGAGEGPSASST